MTIMTNVQVADQIIISRSRFKTRRRTSTIRQRGDGVGVVGIIQSMSMTMSMSIQCTARIIVCRCTTKAVFALAVLLLTTTMAATLVQGGDCSCDNYDNHNTCRRTSGCSWVSSVTSTSSSQRCKGTCYNDIDLLSIVDLDCEGADATVAMCVGPPTELHVCSSRGAQQGLFANHNSKTLCEWTDWFCQWNMNNDSSDSSTPQDQDECTLFPQACDAPVDSSQIALEHDECQMLGCTWHMQANPACHSIHIPDATSTNSSSEDPSSLQQASSPPAMGMRMITSAIVTGIIALIFIAMCYSSVIFCQQGPKSNDSPHENQGGSIMPHHAHGDADLNHHPGRDYDGDLSLSGHSPRHDRELDMEFAGNVNVDFHPSQLLSSSIPRPLGRAERSSSHADSIAATTLSCDVPIPKHRLPYSIPGLPRH
jgi:hypothetical protein